MLLGSETSSTVSSRGVYKFPVEKKYDALYDDHQSSSYDLEYCSWSNVPDDDLALAEDYPWTMGQFVWTGFDYLGEPSPYDTDAWPNHSSMFGIIDLASIPKDRYWLYQRHSPHPPSLELGGPRGRSHPGICLHLLPQGRALPQRQEPGHPGKMRQHPPAPIPPDVE